MGALAQLGYLVASILFILGLKRLNAPATARSGNRLSAVGMLLAIGMLVDAAVVVVENIEAHGSDPDRPVLSRLHVIYRAVGEVAVGEVVGIHQQLVARAAPGQGWTSPPPPFFDSRNDGARHVGRHEQQQQFGRRLARLLRQPHRAGFPLGPPGPERSPPGHRRAP